MSNPQTNEFAALVALCPSCGRMQTLTPKHEDALLKMEKITCNACEATGKVDAETKVDIHYQRLITKKQDDGGGAA